MIDEDLYKRKSGYKINDCESKHYFKSTKVFASFKQYINNKQYINLQIEKYIFLLLFFLKNLFFIVFFKRN